jgi:hypothetical protein
MPDGNQPSRTMAPASRSEDPPENPFDGEQWIDSLAGIKYTWLADEQVWVEF